MQKSTRIKLRILVVFFAAIIFFVVVMYSQIPTISDVSLERSSFYDEVVAETNDKIPFKPKSNNFTSVSAYQQIVDMIETESMLEKIDDEQQDLCKTYVESATVKNIRNISGSIVNSGKWNSQLMNDMDKSCALALSLPHCDAENRSKLTHYRSVVSKYNRAQQIIYSSNSFSSVSLSRELISSASSLLNDADMKHSSSLIASLGEVRSKLYHAHLTHVRSVVSQSGNNTHQADVACDQFVSNSNIYGKPTVEAERDIAPQREQLNKKHVQKVEQKVKEQRQKVYIDDDQW